MIDEIFNMAEINVTLNFTTALLTIFTAFVLGIVISFTFMKTNNKGASSPQGFSLTLVMLPPIIAIIILLIGNNVARAFGLSGAFAIIRFRSAAGDPKDISYVLFAMAAGLSCGSGFFGYAALFTAILCLFMVVLNKMNFGVSNVTSKLLKITIPEDLDYQGVFDDVFEKYTTSYELRKIKTTDLGTLFELVYSVKMKEDINQKEFLDALRCRNGNLNIILSMNADVASY
ncbi:DUF4956 domain-containing protein [Pseudobacteroides cellulosolvens]|uniref:DUF4956 domain-containing protein n=1 Tax=Pseudobacteroides cellulosolvens ATCC 35603 = DSM 2933 TaxID=398512 RepID=A0A0L6JVY2_9FIRM|nr:DUF4956 domain-containing protein [Pseudobacteroides cellulosolvens]KNY29993.1 hypothetical protein Bccel_5270 [Pseudobacteroides cellulosolvens ATCC 35603 = DSM 2933]